MKHLEHMRFFKIIPMDEVLCMDDVDIVICTTKYYNEVKNRLISKGITDSRIIDVRGYFTCGSGDEYFYEDFLEYGDN